MTSTARPDGGPRIDGDTRGDASTIRLPARALPRLAGRRLLLLNRRDMRHSQAGGVEVYAHEIARRWVAAGAEVTWLTARDAGQSAREEIDGITVLRAGSALSVHARSALRLLRPGAGFDAVLDSQDGVPIFTRGTVPVVQLVHHVHQDRFAPRSSPAGAAVGRLLEGRTAERVHEGRRIVAVSASTRQELRRRWHVDGVVEVVPHGCAGRDTTHDPGDRDLSTRADVPTIVVTSRLVPHQRIEELLHAVSAAVPDVPDLQVEIIGDGPELTTLRRTAVELGLGRVVRFRGRLPDGERDALTDTAWLTTSTSEGEGWGCAVLEAAAAGVPCLAIRAAGIGDSVVDGATGWLVDGVDDLAAALPRVLRELADPVRAREVSDACRRWSGCFRWDRSAELLAGVMVSEIEDLSRSGLDDTTRPAADRSALHRAATRRRARSDMTTLARFRHHDPVAAVAGLRLTDEAAVRGDEVVALLRGCDEVDALAVLERLRAVEVRVRLASRHELLGGPELVATAQP